jgi:hypothetical protein
MSANSSLAIRIAAIFDNKGLKQAEKGVKSLQSSVKKLAGAAGIGLSTAAVIRFGKSAAKAFIEDEKAANRLAISVRNLGLGFQTPRIESYISELSKMSGVTDDQLRPAMQRLLQTTGSVTKAQELLAQATEISSGSGVSYETVVSDLSAAYVGQTRGLRKYALGVTQAELKTMKFAEVQERLNKQFSGANAEYLTTYAGKLQLITTAAGEASEKIGGALVESLVSVFAAGDTTDFVNQIDTLATKIADTVSSVVFGFQKLYVLTSDRAILASFNPFDDYEKNALAAIEAAEKAAKFRRNMPATGYQGSQPMGIYETSAQRTARVKAERDAARRAKELAATAKKTLDTQKKQNALTKASQTLDLERIGIAAALQGQISETDRLSLNLQLALLDKNDAVATKLAAELETAIQRQNMLQAALLATPEAPNPYRNWKIPDLGPLGGLAAGVIAGVNPSATAIADVPAVSVGGGGVIPDFNVPANAYSQVGPMGGLAAGVIAGVNPQPVINVVVEVAGEEVAAVITQQQTNKSLSGSFVGVNRTARFGTRVDEG